jgi:ATP-dependent Lon protease
MKKSLLASLCVAALALTACDKKTNEAPASSATSTATTPTTTPPVTASLSSNNTADIKSDLDQIQMLSNRNSQEATDLQNKANQAAQKGDKAVLTSTVAQMKTYINKFNQELDALKLKSSEVNAVRDKIKESNNLGIALAETTLESSPDKQKVTELQNRAAQLQKELMTEMQALQNQVKTAPAKTAP